MRCVSSPLVTKRLRHFPKMSLRRQIAQRILDHVFVLHSAPTYSTYLSMADNYVKMKINAFVVILIHNLMPTIFSSRLDLASN